MTRYTEFRTRYIKMGEGFTDAPIIIKHHSRKVKAMQKNSDHLWVVTLTKHRSTWTHCAMNPQGGSGGSSYCGPLRIAIQRATCNIPKGAVYRLMINGRDRGIFRKEWDGR